MPNEQSLRAEAAGRIPPLVSHASIPRSKGQRGGRGVCLPVRPSSRVRPLSVDPLGPSADGRKLALALALDGGPPWSVFNGGKQSARFDSLTAPVGTEFLAATPDDEKMSLARGDSVAWWSGGVAADHSDLRLFSWVRVEGTREGRWQREGGSSLVYERE